MEHRYTITGVTQDGEKVELTQVATIEHEDVDYLAFADVKELEDDEAEAVTMHFFVCTDKTLNEIQDLNLYNVLVDKYNSLVDKSKNTNTKIDYTDEYDSSDDESEDDCEEFDYTFVDEDGEEEEYTFRVIKHIETEDAEYVAAVNVEDLYESEEDQSADPDDEIEVYFFEVYDDGDNVEVEYVDDEELISELLDILLESGE